MRVFTVVQSPSLILNCSIVIYPMDSAIQLLNNWGQIGTFVLGKQITALSIG